MLSRLFRPNPRRTAVEALYGRVSSAARSPALYAAHGVPDTVEGRFEALALHVVLLLRRLRALPAPASEVAQELVDHFFRQLDTALRESGVGDMGVPKRMKTLAQNFYGRAHAYDAALDQPGTAALAEVLARNVTAGEEAEPLAAHMRAAEASLARQDLDSILTSGPAFSEPAAR